MVTAINLVDRYKRFSTIAGLTTLLIGLLAVSLSGFDANALTWLKSVNGTAFLLAGIAILTLQFASKPIRLAGKVSALALLSFCAAQLWSFTCDASASGILSDNPFLGWMTSTFGVMAAPDVLGFLFIALALLFIDLSWKTFRVAELLGIIALLGALMTLIGVLFNVPNFCILVSCLKISPYEAAAFVLPCAAVLTARIDLGCLAIMSSPRAGGVIARRLMPAAIAIPIILGGFKLLAETTHLISGDVALTMAMLGMIVAYLTLLWSNANLLDRMDAQRIVVAQNLEQSEKRIKAIVHQASDAFVAIDTAGKIRHWNGQASKMFGIDETEAVEKGIADLISAPSQPGAIERILKSANAGQAHKPTEIVVCSKSGKEVPIEVSVFPVIAQGEEIVCAFMRDITERKAIEARFRDFYFIVSHELRSPLTSVMVSISLTESDAESKISSRCRTLLAAADESCQRLIKLVNDLLDVKRIEVGKFKLRIEAVDVLEVVALAVANLQGSAIMQAVEIETVVTAVNTIEGDLDRLVQVMINLLSNAIKFSPPSATVRITVSDVCLTLSEPRSDTTSDITSDSGSGGIRFAVSDNGPGVPEDLRPRLFNRFEQGPMLPSFKQVGSGLGLSIVKTIVEEHGGTVGVDSNDSGATFWFQLPAARAAAQPVLAAPLPQNQGSAAEALDA